MDFSFDPSVLQNLMSNPMFMAGVNILGSRGNNVAGNIAQGIQSAQQSQLGPLTVALKKLELQRAQNAMNFNPADYMQTEQSAQNGLLSGAAQQQQQQAIQPGTLPATLAGPIGGGAAAPLAQTPSQGQVNFTPGTPTGQIDLPGLVTAGVKAGMPAQDIQAIGMAMAPQQYAQMQAAAKAMEPYTLAPGAIRGNPLLGQAPTENTNPPPESELGQLTALTRARDQYPQGSPQYNMLDAAIQQKSGAAAQDFRKQTLGMMQYRTFGDPAGNAEIAKAIANYRIAPLSGFALRSPQGQAVMAEVARLNPDYNAQNFQSSQKAYSAFTSGAQGNVVRSMNVGIDHLATLSGLVDALQNNDIQAVNRVANAYKAQTGQTAPTNFDSAKKIIGDEIAKAIVGTQNAAQDRQAMQESLDAAKSPQQLQGVVQTWIKLMGGQLNGLRQQYKTGTMRDDFEKFLLPNSRAALEGGQMKVPVRSGMVNGRRVIQYNDGSIEYK